MLPKNKTSVKDSQQSQKLRIVECHIKISQHTDESILSLIESDCKKQALVLSKNEIKQAISKGALWLTRGKHTQRLRRVKKAPKANDELHFYYNEKVLNSTVSEATLIADHLDYSVWYKPYGMLSQGSKWSDHCTVARYAQQNLPTERPAFIVHRLDRAATGLILIAHSKKAASALSALFEKHDLEKHYNIIVHGNHSVRCQPDVINTEIDGKKARSTFTCLHYDERQDYSLVDVKIDSGRKHQIRKHAASIGLPVVGDRLHGIWQNQAVIDSSDNLDVNLQLCAVSLAFTCPLSGQARLFKLPEHLKPSL